MSIEAPNEIVPELVEGKRNSIGLPVLEVGVGLSGMGVGIIYMSGKNLVGVLIFGYGLVLMHRGLHRMGATLGEMDSYDKPL